LERGLEQRDVAARLGVQLATVGRWERDQKRPAIRHMPRILELLGPGASGLPGSSPEDLRAARRRRGITQAELATRLGVDRRTLGDWERGVRCPGDDTLAAIEESLSRCATKPD
jgi:transcriptional regulator with XRE-family HTH domain